MNTIITTSILDPSIQQPFTGPSLDFLQNATKEQSAAFARGMIGDFYNSAIAYILHGVNPYGTNQYKEGYIFWNGEVYYCPGKSTTTAFANVPVLTITVTNDATADPTIFSDLVPRNVHNVRRLIMSDAVSGSGTFDLSDAVILNKWTAYTPTFAAYDSSDALVAGGVTVTSFSAIYRISGDILHIRMNSIDISTLATVRYVTMTMPSISLLTGTAKRGTGFCRFGKYATTGSGLPVAVNVDLSSSGAGDPFCMEKADKTDFGVLNNYDFRFTIAIALV